MLLAYLELNDVKQDARITNSNPLASSIKLGFFRKAESASGRQAYLRNNIFVFKEC
ncbi:hypothetical protein ACU8KH_04889 [Lachancea thermotolerans]